jgi:Ca2+-binding RTX toxin-like protein
MPTLPDGTNLFCGTQSNDTFWEAFEFNDIVKTYRGNDLIYSDSGVDEFYLNKGDDLAYVNLESEGSVEIHGGKGYDVLYLYGHGRDVHIRGFEEVHLRDVPHD